MMGATLVAVMVVYTVILLPIVINLKGCLSILSQDDALIIETVKYLIPTFMAMPVFEALLCLERAYQIDGRASYFSLKTIIITISNIVLDIVFVTVLHRGMLGLAESSIISTMLGYLLIVGHAFSNKCTIHPEFKVWLNIREAMGYLKENLILGGTDALEEGMAGIVNGLVCRILLTVGGVSALIIWNLISILLDFIEAIVLGIGTSVSLICGALFGQEDYSGVKNIAHKAFKVTFVISCIYAVIVTVFTRPVAYVYNIQGSLIPLSVHVVRILFPVFVIAGMASLFNRYILTVNRVGLLYVLNIVKYILIISGMYVGALYSVTGLFIGFEVAYILLFVTMVILFFKDKNELLPSSENYQIASFSIELAPEPLSENSEIIQNTLLDQGYTSRFANQVALLVEDGGNYIQAQNSRQVFADIRLIMKLDRIVIAFTDNGIPYDFSSDVVGYDNTDNLERKVMDNLSDEIQYDRILELNSLVIKLGNSK